MTPHIKQLNTTPADVPVDRLATYDGNPRHGDVEAIAESIRVNGFYNPLIVQQSTGQVIAGNHRLLAARALGMTEVPVIYVDVTNTEAAKIVLADNATSDKAVNDDLAIGRILRSIQESGEDLTGVAYDTEETTDFLLMVEHDDARTVADATETNPFDWRGAAAEVEGQKQLPTAIKGAPIPGQEKKDPPERETAPAPEKAAAQANTARRVFLLDLPLDAYAWLRARLDEITEERELADDTDAVFDVLAEATGTTAPRLSRADKRLSDPVADGVPTQ